MSVNNYTTCPKCQGSLREDYWQGIERDMVDGFYTYTCNYTATCDDCSWTWQHGQTISISH